MPCDEVEALVSRQWIPTKYLLGNGESHVCPYRHFSIENPISFLQGTWVTDRMVLHGVKE